MTHRTPNFEATLNHRGEVSDQWIDAGGSNVVFRIGDTAVKICLSLPNKHLGDAATADRLEEATHQEIDKINREADIFARYFGNSFLHSEAYAVRGTIHGGIVGKLYDELEWYNCKLPRDKLFEDIPLMVTEQLFFDPYQPSNSEVTTFVIGKGDFNHRAHPPDRATYEYMNHILLEGNHPAQPLKLEEIYDVQKSQSLIYYVLKLRQDSAFKDMMRKLLPKIAQYTHETGGMADLFPLRANGLFIQDGRTGAWTPKFYELSTSDWQHDINDVRHAVLPDPFRPELDDDTVKQACMILSYMRSMNILAIESDLDPLFNILCKNGDPNQQPDCQLSTGGWWAMYERLQEPQLYGNSPASPYISICNSVWKSV